MGRDPEADRADRAGRDALERRVAALEDELAATQRALEVARQSAREAEAELLAARSPGSARPPSAVPPTVSRGRRRVTVDHDEAARDFAQAMAELTGADVAAQARLGREPGPGTTTKGKGKAKGKGKRSPALPTGVAEGSAQAHRHLVTDRGALLVVDGYNVARSAWNGLDPSEERRRVVALLEDLHARWGASVVVVFDGDDATVSPVASRWVAVRYSGSGVTADDDIAGLLRSTPTGQPVVVVSSDREVADDAHRAGAAVIGATDFLAAVGR